jgi:tRNA (guanine37-N1)-methyltransferase
MSKKANPPQNNLKISIITLFPEVLNQNLNFSILKRAQEKKLVEFSIVNHRDFGQGIHKVVDDNPYGGGAGMLLKVDVLNNAIKSAKQNIPGEKVILLDPQGVVYTQEIAEDFSHLSHIILVCGHYEGFDERVRSLVDMELSIGDYVLTGGEIPALAVIDSVTRLIPGVLKDSTATVTESHSKVGGFRLLEGPAYTRPEVFENMRVPSVFLSGNPKKISEYKKKASLEVTKRVRPDLIVEE